MINIINFLKISFTKPKGSNYVSKWKIYFLWLLRISILVTAIFEIIWGERLIALLTLASFIAITTPALATKNKIKDIPIEIEIMLFITVFLQFVLGEIQGFYIKFPYYDKFMHFTIPFLIGVISYIVVYTLYATKRLQAPKRVIIFLVLAITMAFGAIWELAEYANDMIVLKVFPNWHKMQGSGKEDPYFDTMNDLLADVFGAILGSIFAMKFLLNDTKNKKTKRLLNEISHKILDSKKRIK